MSRLPITFALSVAGDPRLVDTCLARLRVAYPDARVLLVTDDTADPAFDTIARTHGAELTRSEPLYAQEAGTRAWRLFFDLDASARADHLFKIDPDTWVRRPFRALPDANQAVVFGRPVLDPYFVSRPHMQGGCIGITRAAVAAIRRSGLLDDEGYRRADYAQALEIHPKHLEERVRTGRLSTDLILADLCYRLGIALVRHPEVYSVWMRPEEFAAWQRRGFDEPVNNPGDRYAVTHPHK